MRRRTRPTECCVIPRQPIPLRPAERDRLLAAFKALGDPTRLDVFRLVAAQEAPICACDVVDRFGVSQPTISHHLKALRDAGLVRASRRGVWAYYAADPDGLALLARGVAALTGEASGMVALEDEPDGLAATG